MRRKARASLRLTPIADTSISITSASLRRPPGAKVPASGHGRIAYLGTKQMESRGRVRRRSPPTPGAAGVTRPSPPTLTETRQSPADRGVAGRCRVRRSYGPRSVGGCDTSESSDADQARGPSRHPQPFPPARWVAGRYTRGASRRLLRSLPGGGGNVYGRAPLTFGWRGVPLFSIAISRTGVEHVILRASRLRLHDHVELAI